MSSKKIFCNITKSKAAMRPILLNSITNLLDHWVFKFYYGVMVGTIFGIGIGANISRVKVGSSYFYPILWGILYSAIVSIIVLLFLWLCFLVYASYIGERKRLYGELLVSLNKCFSRIHMVNKMYTIVDSMNNKDDFNAFKQSVGDMHMFALEEFCDNLKIHFDKKTRSDCCVSIKLFKQGFSSDPQDLRNASLLNLCRTRSFKEIRDTEVYTDTDHTVFENTAFHDIIIQFKKMTDSSENLYFKEGNIPRRIRLKTYNTTSPRENITYRSELVVPILPISFDSKKKPEMLGFVCVDSRKYYRFTAGYDLAILNGLADGIYDATIKHRELSNKIIE